MNERIRRGGAPEVLPTAEPVSPLSSEGEPGSARSARQRQVLEMLEQGTEAILTSEGFGAYLRMMARFHAYSFNNVLLIHTQRPDATVINSYNRWQELGRQVMKGEKGIKIFFPIFRKLEQEDPDSEEIEAQRSLRSFGIGNVFDVSQTEGDPLPEPPMMIHNTDVTDLSMAINLRLSQFLIDAGVRMESRVIESEARGFWDPLGNRIVIRQDETSPFSVTRTGTLVHEAAHREAGHRGHVDRKDAEAVAEGSAYVVLQHFGIDTGQKSFPYIAGWAQDREVLRRNLHEIQKISHALVGHVENTEHPDELWGASEIQVFTSPSR